MKLPSDPKSRMQALALIGIGIVILLFWGGYGLSQLLTYRAKTLAALETKQNQLNQINTTITALPELRRQRDDLFWEIQAAATNYILFHEYRNYHLTAREILLPMATAYDVTLDIPGEGSIVDFPIPEAKVTDRLLKASTTKGSKEYGGPISSTFGLYSITLTGKAGFMPLIAFLRHIEESNPYLTLSDLTISADAQNPGAHPFSIIVLWPIWKNLELKTKPEDLFLPVKDYANSTETP
jgi:hypothetical protein